MATRAAIPRLERQIDKSGACWEYTGYKDKKGYGRFKINGKHVGAHRFAYETYIGPIPKGKGYHGTCVLHTCDNPGCVNPEHLWLGTVEDNNIDTMVKGRNLPFGYVPKYRRTD